MLYKVNIMKEKMDEKTLQKLTDGQKQAVQKIFKTVSGTDQLFRAISVSESDEKTIVNVHGLNTSTWTSFDVDCIKPMSIKSIQFWDGKNGSANGYVALIYDEINTEFQIYFEDLRH